MQTAERETRRHLMQLTGIVIGVVEVTLEDEQLPAGGKCPDSTDSEDCEGEFLFLVPFSIRREENCANPRWTHVAQERMKV